MVTETASRSLAIGLVEVGMQDHVRFTEPTYGHVKRYNQDIFIVEKKSITSYGWTVRVYIPFTTEDGHPSSYTVTLEKNVKTLNDVGAVMWNWACQDEK